MGTLKTERIIKTLENISSISPDKFFFRFLEAYGFSRTTIQKLKDGIGNRNIGIQEGDYGLEKEIYFRPLESSEDVSTELDLLRRDERIKNKHVRFFIVTDFSLLAAYDGKADDSILIDLSDLKSYYDFFLPLTGLYEKPLVYSAHPADVKACEKMGRLYDIIRVDNKYTDETIHSLNIFLTRLLFCFFAEDTEIFPKHEQLTNAITAMTKKDGSDLSRFFEQLFEILDLPANSPKRKSYPATLQEFPYVNGGLFSENCFIPKFKTKARNLLLDCARLSWKEISPAIFGAMFQSVMDQQKRRELGAHYTSEKNILKAINPLFLDDLKEELQSILEMKKSSNKVRRLHEYQNKLASIKILDPACGCGNFLVVSYRELKLLELKAVETLLADRVDKDRFLLTDWVKDYSKVSIDQFFGVEIEEFPADVARVSMWLMDHVMNCRFGELLGTVIPSIPLKVGAQIVCANALTTDWATVFPVQELSYIVGNPPFVGASTMTKEQKSDVMRVFDGVKCAGILDYVTAWYGKSAALLDKNAAIECAFVSTNSVCQGEQVAPLWGELFNRGIHINFAHQTFQWRNEAKDNAGVYCVIVGFGKKSREHKKLFVYDNPKAEPKTCEVKRINAYLIDADEQIFVRGRASSFQAPNEMVYGNKPTDGGNLIIEPEDYDQFAMVEALRPYIKKLIGGRELLYNLPRYCLWLTNAPETILRLPLVSERIERCRRMRLSSRDSGCRKLAARAHEFRDLNNPKTAIVVPRISSERREYIPMGFVESNTILTDLCHMIPNGTLYDFGILESRLHMTWMRTVCGRLESRYRYSRDLCYNTFPWPKTTEAQCEVIKNLAGNVLVAREMHPEMTLADLYDPDKMPDDLRRAHLELDLAVDKLYRRKPFSCDEERLKHLFKRYEKLIHGEDGTEFFNEE